MLSREFRKEIPQQQDACGWGSSSFIEIPLRREDGRNAVAGGERCRSRVVPCSNRYILVCKAEEELELG